jgi:hypothetical protein
MLPLFQTLGRKHFTIKLNGMLLSLSIMLAVGFFFFWKIFFYQIEEVPFYSCFSEC